MKWLAAMTMATQIASAAVGVTASAQTAPALTPQQKQELSTYDFKGAEAALEAQDNQPALEAKPADSDSSIEGSAGCEPDCPSSKRINSVFTRWRSGGQRLGGSAELETSSRGAELRGG